ncbi:MAG: mercuric transport protein [Burkholderiaceae bacterium]|nr:mercuric transport protein [Burkholderiaceae bacterium]
MPDSLSSQSIRRDGSAPALFAAGVAAVLASTCCVAPLLLAVIGISGAWLSRLHWLAPYSTPLVLMAVALLGVAGWRLYRRAPADGQACSADGATLCAVNVAARRWFWLVVLLTLIPVLVPLAAPLFY